MNKKNLVLRGGMYMTQDHANKLEEFGLKAIPYYFEQGVSVVLLVNPNSIVVARGVAVRSPLDTYDRINGRIKAIGHAIGAFMHQKSSLDIRPRKVKKDPRMPMNIASAMFHHQKEYMPVLTNYELSIMEKIGLRNSFRLVRNDGQEDGKSL